MPHSRILGIGHYLPPRVVTNFDVMKMMETSDEFIVERTGVRRRRHADDVEDRVEGAHLVEVHLFDRDAVHQLQTVDRRSALGREGGGDQCLLLAQRAHGGCQFRSI